LALGGAVATTLRIQEDGMADVENAQAVRVHRFASFFKHYMGVSTIVAAALPIPVAEMKLIPVYDAQKHFLAVYTSLFCFLIFAFCFYIRHSYGQLLFFNKVDGLMARDDRPHLYILALRVQRQILNILPLVLIVVSMAFVFQYHAQLDRSMALGRTGADGLMTAALGEIPNSVLLMVYYLAIFMTAELAFVLMAMKEYLLDLLHIDDEFLIRYQGRGSGSPESV
jgi:hypothetical protein